MASETKEGDGNEMNDLNEAASETNKLFDVLDSEEKTKTEEFVKGYCLYRHMTNRLGFCILCELTTNYRPKYYVKLP